VDLADRKRRLRRELRQRLGAVAPGQAAEASEPLEEARQIFARLDAQPLLRVVEDIVGSQRSATAG